MVSETDLVVSLSNHLCVCVCLCVGVGVFACVSVWVCGCGCAHEQYMSDKLSVALSLMLHLIKIAIKLYVKDLCNGITRGSKSRLKEHNPVNLKFIHAFPTVFLECWF